MGTLESSHPFLGSQRETLGSELIHSSRLLLNDQTCSAEREHGCPHPRPSLTQVLRGADGEGQASERTCSPPWGSSMTPEPGHGTGQTAPGRGGRHCSDSLERATLVRLEPEAPSALGQTALLTSH